MGAFLEKPPPPTPPFPPHGLAEVKQFIEDGYNVNGMWDNLSVAYGSRHEYFVSEGYGLLHMSRTKDEVSLLIANKADVNLRRPQRMVGGLETPLHVIAQRSANCRGLLLRSMPDDGDVIRLLIQSKADPNAEDRYGCTPLYIAIQNRSYAAVELIMNGADCNMRSHSGLSAFHLVQIKSWYADNPSYSSGILKWMITKGRADPWAVPILTKSSYRPSDFILFSQTPKLSYYRLPAQFSISEKTFYLLMTEALRRRMLMSLLMPNPTSVITHASRRPLFERFLLRVILRYADLIRE